MTRADTSLGCSYLSHSVRRRQNSRLLHRRPRPRLGKKRFKSCSEPSAHRSCILHWTTVAIVAITSAVRVHLPSSLQGSHAIVVGELRISQIVQEEYTTSFERTMWTVGRRLNSACLLSRQGRKSGSFWRVSSEIVALLLVTVDTDAHGRRQESRS